MTDDPLALLLTRVASQDRAAFRDLYSAASAKLFGTLVRILGNRAEAEDALQEVFTRVWLRAARYDAERGRAMTWLIAIARNHAIDRIRSRPDTGGGEDETDLLPDTRPGVEAGLIARGEAERVVHCLGTLEPDRAEAVRGAYMGGLSYQQLAEKFDVPLNTMRTWLRRSLMKLKDCLDA